MKIDSISSTTYSPVSQRGPANTPKTAAPEHKAPATSGASLSSNGLTGAERAFFAKLFPESSLQINTHSTYSQNGVQSSVQLGQIINRKV